MTVMNPLNTTVGTHRFRWARLILGGSMMVMGGCGIIYEYMLGLLGNNLMGSSHEQIFVIIGIMMFAMGIGAALQRKLGGTIIDWFLCIELALGLFGGISAVVIYTAFVYTSFYQLVLYGFAGTIGLLIGLEIPLLIRINSGYTDSLPMNLSDILCMDYVGALLGALLFTYVLVTRVSLGSMGFALGVVNTLLALGGFLYFRSLVTNPRRIMAGIGLTLVILLFGLWRVDGWVAGLEQRCFDDPIIHSQTTKYQHLVLTKRKDDLRLYINGHLQFSSRDEAIYHEMLVHVPMAVADRRERVLILGGGDGLALREVLRYGDVKQVTLVDIDAEIIRLASEHPDLVKLNDGALHDARVFAEVAGGIEPGQVVPVVRASKLPRAMPEHKRYHLADVHVWTVDAERFVREAEGRYDVIVIDLPDPRQLEIAKLYSVGFYRALSRRLAVGGVMSVQSTSPARAGRVFQCIGKSLREAGWRVLPYRDYLPSFGDWGWHLAWRKGAPVESVRQRFEELDRMEVHTCYVTPQVIRASFSFGRGRLEPDVSILASTMFRPVIVDYYRQGFE